LRQPAAPPAHISLPLGPDEVPALL
jgi:hypothetical protein